MYKTRPQTTNIFELILLNHELDKSSEWLYREDTFIGVIKYDKWIANKLKNENQNTWGYPSSSGIPCIQTDR